MTLPSTDTAVTFPSGALEGTATILHIENLDGGRRAVLLDTTPCHPVDLAWPDQQADAAELRTETGTTTVLDCVVAATDGENLHIGADVPVRKGAEGWAFVAAHIVDGDLSLAEGQAVTISVDGPFRAALSAGHTGCHLASLALNAEVANLWKKDVPLDSAGNPNFDAQAIDRSLITENGSLDDYRLGKSLRRKGFDTEALLGHLAETQDGINRTLAGWVAAGSRVHIEAPAPDLSARRLWVADLPDGAVSIPCGGTHLSSLSELSSISVVLTATADGGTPVVRMTTQCVVVQ